MQGYGAIAGSGADAAMKACYNEVGGKSANLATAVPATITSAAARIDALQDRLIGIRKHVESIADMIGGPRPTSGQIKGDTPPPSSAVGRLNGGADACHSILCEIEDSLNAISRSLG